MRSPVMVKAYVYNTGLPNAELIARIDFVNRGGHGVLHNAI